MVGARNTPHTATYSSEYCKKKKRIIHRHLADGYQFFTTGKMAMLRYALMFFIVAMIAGILGFGLIANTFMEGARILFIVFVVLFLLSLLSSVLRRNAT